MLWHGYFAKKKNNNNNNNKTLFTVHLLLFVWFFNFIFYFYFLFFKAVQFPHLASIKVACLPSLSGGQDSLSG
jgi:hypothetical protein